MFLKKKKKKKNHQTGSCSVSDSKTTQCEWELADEGCRSAAI